ncbi:MAG TPA: hypothetical protein PK760_11280 [Flavobacteriales bacterium]|nr:hypothetical protein [Flavobacteriales bacterium]
MSASYLGKAGQFLVMSKLLYRGWNVATPEVDVGDDIFVVRDANGQLIRVQVKTATGKQTSSGIRDQFSVNLAQLVSQVSPMLIYAFVIRFEGGWQGITLIEQKVLLLEHQNSKVGSESGKNLILSFLLKDKHLSCSKRDFSVFLNNFEDFEEILH